MNNQAFKELEQLMMIVKVKIDAIDKMDQILEDPLLCDIIDKDKFSNIRNGHINDLKNQKLSVTCEDKKPYIRSNQKMTCECGCKVLKANISVHRKTPKHSRLLNNYNLKLYK